MWNVGFGTSRMSWRCVRSIIRSSPASGAHIFVAALALLVQRLLERRLRNAGIEFSSARAMEALSTVRHVTFRVEGEGRRGGVAGRPARPEGPEDRQAQAADAPPRGRGHGDVVTN